MSLDYISRRVVDTYVFHDNQFKEVLGVGLLPDGTEHRLPEDTLPHVELHVGGGDIPMSEAQFIFPPDGYAKVDGVARYGRRTLRRAWRWGPCSESYRVAGNFRDWLNARQHPTYDPPESLWIPSTDQLVFSRCLAYIPEDRVGGAIMLNGTGVGRVIRDEKSQRITLDHNIDLPPSVFPFHAQLGVDLPVDWGPEGVPDIDPNREPDPAPAGRLNFPQWIRVSTKAAVTEPFHFYAGTYYGTPCIIFRDHRNERIRISDRPDATQIMPAYAMGGRGPRLRGISGVYAEDMRTLWDTYIEGESLL